MSRNDRERPELDLLGVQISLARRFLESGFDPGLEVYDDVNNESRPAKDVFFEQGGRWYMQADALPGHIAVKAVGVDAEGLYLETSPIDPEKARAMIVERMLPFEYRTAEPTTAFVDLTTGKPVILVGPPAKPAEEDIELGERCLWTIPLSGLDGVRKDAAIRLADAVYTAEAYLVETPEVEVGPVTSKAAAQRVSIKLQLGFQQLLQMEQRPILSVRQELGVTATVSGRLELRQIMAVNQRLSRMGPSEMTAFFAEFVATHGERAAMNVAVFALAGKLKPVLPPGTSWRDARKMARKLVRAGR